MERSTALSRPENRDLGLGGTMSRHKTFVILLAAMYVLLIAPMDALRAQAFYNAINVLDYGADPTGKSDSTTAFNRWWSACSHEQTTKTLCSIPSGTYSFNADLILDFSGNPGGGVVVQGAGQNKTLLEFADGKYLSIIDSAGGGAFYGTFSNFGVLATNPSGAALQLGQTNFSDALNSFAFRDIWVKNLASVTGSAGLQLNQVYSSAFSNVTTSDGCPESDGNCPNGGDSLLLTQSSFNTFQGSFSEARNGVRLAVGYNFGNVFTSPDLEVNYDDLVIQDATSTHNTFIGGQWVYVGNALYASAGSGNVVEYANFSGSIPSAGPAVGLASGLTVKGAYSFVSTPPFPSSGQVIANTTGRDVFVNLYNMINPTICYGPGATTCITPGSSTTILVRNGDSIKVDSRGPGNWVWSEAY